MRLSIPHLAPFVTVFVVVLAACTKAPKETYDSFDGEELDVVWTNDRYVSGAQASDVGVNQPTPAFGHSSQEGSEWKKPQKIRS